MPKKRIKKSGNISKSGILTQNFRKELKVNSHLNNFVLRDTFHNENKNEVDKVQFNDSNTIIFNNKNVNATLGIEKKYVEGDFLSKNKIVNTPNEFSHDSSFEVEKIVNPEDYKHIIYSNYIDELSSDRYKRFNDEFVNFETFSSTNKADLVSKTSDYEKIIYNFKKKRYEIKKNFEEININFNKNFLNMSFNLNNNVDDYLNNSVQKNLPLIKNHLNQFYLALNNNTVYLDNNTVNDENTYYSLGNCKFNYFSNISNFTKAAISNNPLSLYNNDIIGNNGSTSFGPDVSISNSITDFGFPFDKRFRGNEEVEIDVSKYIKEDFILEKVYLEFKIKNFAVSTNIDQPCFNTLNFFILNQRGDIDTVNKKYDNYFLENNQRLKNIFYWDNSSSSLKFTGNNVGFDNNDNLDCFVTRTNFVPNTISGKFDTAFSYELNQIDSKDGKTIISSTKLNNDSVFLHENKDFKNSKYRELITNIKIANIGNILQSQNGFFSKNPPSNFDYIVYTDSVSNAGLNNLGVDVKDYIINDDFKEVKILSTVKSFKENKKLKKFSQFEIYPEQGNKRAGLKANSEKSINSENDIAIDRSTILDENSIEIDYGASTSSLNTNQHDNPYILSPKDKLIFGFNFCPSMILQTFSNEELIQDLSNVYDDYNGRDVVVLDLRNLKIKLLGRYVSENKVFTPKKNEFENCNIKKINEYSTNVVDKLGLPSQFMLKGNYYNRFTSISSVYPDFISKGGNTFSGFISIPQVSSSSISYGLSEMNSSMYVTGSSDQSANIVSYLRDDIKYKDSNYYLNYKFKVDHFGFVSDKINYNRHNAYINTRTQKNTYNIEKYFRKNGLYIQKNESLDPPDVINSYNKDKNASLTDPKFVDRS